MSARAPRRPVGPALALLLSACAGEADAPVAWPPVAGQPFPDLRALDHRGQRVQLSSLRGKVLLIEPIGLTCAGCVAFCGGHDYGAFEGTEPQEGLEALESYFPDYAGVSLAHEDLVVVEMLFFNAAMETPSVQDAMRWFQHFHLAEQPNHLVLIGPEALRDSTRGSIPGFWLVDRDFVLVKDATGHRPRHNLYSELLPTVPKLLARTAAAPR